jgi:hypothetical protein
MLDRYLIFFDHMIFLNTVFIMVVLKQCGRVTNYNNFIILVSNFFKAIKGAWWMPWV